MIFTTKPDHLWRRYVLAIVLIAVSITASHFIATRSSGQSAQIAADVNLSGRQRMLSQRITLFARSLIDPEASADQAQLLDLVKHDIQLFVESHDALKSRAYLSETHRTLYSGKADGVGLDRQVEEFVSLVGAIVAASEQGNARDGADDLSALQALATGDLLRALNDAVLAFQGTAQNVEQQEMRTSHIIFATALLLLLLEAIFIFWPAHHAIRTALKKLRLERAKADFQKEEAEKAAEFAQQSLAAKTNFFNMLSHELRTPLNGIVAGADLLNDSNADQEIVQMIAKAGDELTEKIEQLLEISSTVPGDDQANWKRKNTADSVSKDYTFDTHIKMRKGVFST